MHTGSATESQSVSRDKGRRFRVRERGDAWEVYDATRVGVAVGPFRLGDALDIAERANRAVAS